MPTPSKTREFPARALSALLPAVALSFLLFAPAAARAQVRGIDVVARQATGQADLDVGRQYAVIIGIDKYGEWPSLRGAVAEARQVKSVLARRYWIDEFIELYDGEATAANIRRLFTQSLPAKLEMRDSLLVFYAGHGYTDSTKTGFWIASDGTSDVDDQSRWIPNQQLRNMVANLKAQRILVMADACFSGDFLDTKRGPVQRIDSAYYRTALRLTARQVLTSGSSESVPDESEFGRQLVNLHERNTEALIDPNTMYDRIRLGVSKTQPLFGTMPGNEQGASFVLFLKTQAAATGGGSGRGGTTGSGGTGSAAPATPRLSVARSYGSLSIDVAAGGILFMDGKEVGELPSGEGHRLDDVEAGTRSLELRYAGGERETRSVRVEKGGVAAAMDSLRDR
jgi:hypothetical protein